MLVSVPQHASVTRAGYPPALRCPPHSATPCSDRQAGGLGGEAGEGSRLSPTPCCLRGPVAPQISPLLLCVSTQPLLPTLARWGCLVPGRLPSWRGASGGGQGSHRRPEQSLRLCSGLASRTPAPAAGEPAAGASSGGAPGLAAMRGVRLPPAGAGRAGTPPREEHPGVATSLSSGRFHSPHASLLSLPFTG